MASYIWIAHPIRNSRDIARRNAQQAAIVLAQRRREREEVERYLAGLTDQDLVRIPRQRVGGTL